jgi:hypothetical protein
MLNHFLFSDSIIFHLLLFLCALKHAPEVIPFMMAIECSRPVKVGYEFICAERAKCEGVRESA